MASNLRVASALGIAFLLLLWAWVGGAMLGAAPRDTGRALTTSASNVDWINVTVSDQLRFTLTSSPVNTAEVSPGALVHVAVQQLGSTPHTFTLSPEADYQFPTSTTTTSDLDAYFHNHTALIDLTIGTSTGSMVYGNFTAPAYGEYEYVCLEPGHFQAGMWGILGSGEAGTGAGALPYNGPGAPVFIIAGTITALVIIALVLGFVIGKRRGSSEEMPPERLGYPEPFAPGASPPPPDPTGQKG